MSIALEKLGDRKKAIESAEAALKIYEEINIPKQRGSESNSRSGETEQS